MPEHDRPLIFVHALAPPYEGGTTVITQRMLSSLFPPEVVTVTDLWLRPRLQPTGHRVPARTAGSCSCRPGGSMARRADRRDVGEHRPGAPSGAYAALWPTPERRLDPVGGGHGFSVIAVTLPLVCQDAPRHLGVRPLGENAYNEAALRTLVRRLERGIWRRAATILCHAEEMCAYYAHKHGAACTVLETPIVLPATSDPSARPISRPPYEVLYAGAVYWAQEDAVKRLARVCAQLDDDVRLTIVGDEAQLRAAGSGGSLRAAIACGRLRERVRQADVVVSD
jgi:hypothetical protein